MNDLVDEEEDCLGRRRHDRGDTHETLHGTLRGSPGGRDPLALHDLAAPEAKAALDLIVSRANTSVDIFCDDLSLEAYQPALLADAARRRCRVRVVVYDPVVVPHSALIGLVDEIRSGKVQVRRTSPVIVLDDGYRLSVKPFAVCDGRHVRAEGYAQGRLATVILNADRGAATEVGKASVEFFKLLWKEGAEWRMPGV